MKDQNFSLASRLSQDGGHHARTLSTEDE